MEQLKTTLQELAKKHGAAAVLAAAIQVLQCKCAKCGNTWTPRGGNVPAQCPACKSVKWNAQPASLTLPREVTMMSTTPQLHGWIHSTYHGAPVGMEQIAAELQVNGYTVVPWPKELQVFLGAELIAVIK